MASEFKKFEDKLVQVDIEDELLEVSRGKKFLKHLKLPQDNTNTSMINTLLFGIYLELRKFNNSLKLDFTK